MTSHARLPITFHPVLDDQFDSWAADCKQDPKTLRSKSRMAVRARHPEAFIEHESHRANGRRPNIYTLRLGSIDMYYTVEAEAIVIRGYGWKLDREQLDDFDGGGLYTEFNW